MLKNKIIVYFVKFVATKKGKTSNFTPSSLVDGVGSDILDPG
jgi:hypothetical protein